MQILFALAAFVLHGSAVSPCYEAVGKLRVSARGPVLSTKGADGVWLEILFGEREKPELAFRSYRLDGSVVTARFNSQSPLKSGKLNIARLFALEPRAALESSSEARLLAVSCDPTSP